MTDLAAGLRELSEPWPPGSKVKEAINRAARASGLSYWRAFDIWYGKARRIEHHEWEMVSRALEKAQQKAARNELHELKTRLAVLEARLNQVDQDFHRPEIDRVGQQVRQLRRVDRT